MAFSIIGPTMFEDIESANSWISIFPLERGAGLNFLDFSAIFGWLVADVTAAQGEEGGVGEERINNSCTHMAFLHCVFSNELSNYLRWRMHNCTDCMCLTFLHVVFLNVSSVYLHIWMHGHTGCI